MRREFLLALTFASLAACARQNVAVVENVDLGGDVDGGPIVQGAPSIASPSANVRFLNAPRMELSFSRALGLATNELCMELGQYGCIKQIHQIALLGTEPYSLGVFDPQRTTGVTTPLVVERVALTGCIERVTRDRATPASGQIFHQLVIDAAGHMDPQSPEVATAIDRLYTRTLQRHATLTEIDHLKSLYTEIEALGDASAGRSWAVASCVAVLTSMESLFY